MAKQSIYVRRVYPPGRLTISIEVDATIADLKTEISKQFKIEEVTAGRHTMVLSKFCHDVIPLEDPLQKISSLSITESDSVCLIPPNDLKPPISKRAGTEKKAAAKAEEPESDDEEKKFKDFTLKNCVEKYESGKEKEKKLALEYIEIHIDELLAESALRKAKEDTLKQILLSENLQVEELPLFEAVVDWGKQKAEEEKKELKAVVSGLLPFIRFPLMSTSQLASKVAPSGLVESHHIVTLFTYTSQTSEEKKLPAEFPYPGKLREGKGPPCCWDAKNMDSGIVITDSKKWNVTFPGYDSIVRATRSFGGSEKYYWEVTFTGSNSLRVGLLDDTVSDWKKDLWQVGWAILGKGGDGVYLKGGSIMSTTHYGPGDTVGLALDMKKRLCTYYLNGRRIEVVFRGLPPKVWPAVSNGTGTTTITTKFGLPWPKDADLSE